MKNRVLKVLKKLEAKAKSEGMKVNAIEQYKNMSQKQKHQINSIINAEWNKRHGKLISSSK